MEISFFTIQTPALLFPTISLLMLAYTNRFLGITSVIRKLHADMNDDVKNHKFYFSQIESLSKRINLIIKAQKAGVVSLLLCVISMITIFISIKISLIMFGLALLLMSTSLFLTIQELSLSKEALTYILEDCKKLDQERK